MRYYIGVEAAGEGRSPSVLDAFKQAAEKTFADTGVEITATKNQLVIACPTRTVREEVRHFINSRSDVREPVIPAPKIL